MRTSAPTVLPIFRSEMQMRLLALLLLQAERQWALHELADALGAPMSSVHRELERAEAAGLIRRDSTSRPHRFQAAIDDPFYEPLATLLRRSVGVEEDLRVALDASGVHAAAIHGSWVTGQRRPNSDIDVLVVGDAELADLRRRVRPVGKRAGRRVDVTLLSEAELRGLAASGSSFVRSVIEGETIPLVGSLDSIAHQ
jgi:predicted nucleotidyltransferase